MNEDHIIYGCVIKKVDEWIEWLKGNEEFKTSIISDDFKIIEMALNLDIEQHKQLNR